MKYRKAGYKYLLAENYTRNLHGNYGDVDFEFFTIKDGSITVKKGYAWDGASGPTIDTKNSMRGSLIHDSLYQGIRLGLISRDKQKIADKEFFKIIIEDGMCPFRASCWYLMLRILSPFTCNRYLSKDIVIEI